MINTENMLWASTAIFALLTLSVHAADIDSTLPWTDGGEIRVEINTGEIEIRGWDKNEVRLNGDFKGSSDQLVFKQSGKNIKLAIKDQGDSWWGGNSSSNVDFVVYAPYSSDLDIDGTSLNVETKEIRGNLDINSISGRVRANGESRRVHIETVSGDIDLENANGRIRLRSVSGDINADVQALNFDAKTVSGDIDAVVGQNEYASLLTVSGDVEIEITLTDDSRFEGQTVSGNLEVNFNESKVNAEFDIHTGPGGDVRNRLSKHRPSDDSHWGDQLNFSLGDGDASVELKTMSGTIILE